MGRLCERPGCSEPGEIAYGFDTAMLLVWLRQIDPTENRSVAGVLCLRHADSMVLPRDWTLDDARDVIPRLFPGRGDPVSKPAADRRRRPTRDKRTAAGRQLHLEPVADDAIPDVAAFARRPGAAGERAVGADEATVTALTGVSSKADPDATEALPWRPEFDADDDLGGALAAETPMLARAFRAGARRKP